jgi:hypothetical protein
MVGTADGMTEKETAAHLEGLQRYHSAVEKVHLAEAELARVRADLAKSGVLLEVGEMHW